MTEAAPKPDSAGNPAVSIRSLKGWQVTTSVGPASLLHERPIPTTPIPEIWVHYVDGDAIVLGSTQTDDVLDGARARADGVEICRRRSGGGLVALSPGAVCWIDVIVPAGSALWDDDVGRAFDWLGRTWAEALEMALRAPGRSAEVEVHRGPLQDRTAGRLVCFASLGPGEVTIEGRKVVGISQRRTKRAARFQAMAIGPWEPRLLARYVDAERLRAVGLDLNRLRAGMKADIWPGADRMAAMFCRAVPSPFQRPG